MQQQAKNSPAPRPTMPELVKVGLDPAMATALLAQDVNAVAAAAGIASNSVIAAALGLETDERGAQGEDPILAAWASEEEGEHVATDHDESQREGEASRGGGISGGLPGDKEEGPPDPRGDGHNEREEDDSRVDEGRKEVGGGMHRDTPGGPDDGEGSGQHGRLNPTLADHASKTFWRGVAKTATGMGLTHAGAHMHHYLDNSGSTLELDLDDLESTCPVFAEDVQHSRATVRNDMMEGVDGAIEVGTTFCDDQQYTGYFSKSSSQDWYYAIGGSTRNAAFHAECTSLDTHAVVAVEVQWEMVDTYNWDEGKSVRIGGVTVDDSTLGRLHAVGLAREYAVRGYRTDTFEVRLPRNEDPVCPGKDTERGETPPSDREGRESMEDRG